MTDIEHLQWVNKQPLVVYAKISNSPKMLNHILRTIFISSAVQKHFGDLGT